MAVKRESLEKYVQKDEWFNGNAYKDHESHHHAFVLVMVNCLIDELEKGGKIDVPIKDVVREVLSWGAVTHDVEAAGEYEEHGIRAAEWVGEHMQDKIAPELLPLVQFLCWAHVPHPVEEWWPMPSHIKQMLLIFKDGDRLHRVRFEAGDDKLDQGLLSTSKAKSLIPLAQELHERTNTKYSNAREAFEAVFDVAVEMGLINQ